MRDLLGFGTIALDRIRLAPRIVGAGEKGLCGPAGTFPGGATVNHLAWASALGLKTGFLGLVGPDPEARFLKRAMADAGIGLSGLLAGKGDTASSDLFVDRTGERAIYMRPGLSSSLSSGFVRRHWREALGYARIVSTDIAQVPFEALIEALRVAKRKGARIAVDLDLPPSQTRRLGSAAQLERILGMADILKPTLPAAAELSGCSDILAAARKLATGSRIVAVTDGSRGAAMAMKTGSFRIPAFSVHAKDATGAGDAFFGGMLYGLAGGFSLRQAGRLGAACGALCASTLGAFPPPDARRRVSRLCGVRLPAPRASAKRCIPPASLALEAAAEALRRTALEADLDALSGAVGLLVEALRSGGSLHLAGVGKAAFIAGRAAATLSSWGIPARTLDCGSAPHGDLGQVRTGDAVIAVSKSGETAELLAVARALKARGIPRVAVTGAPRSRLARMATAVLAHPHVEEGGPYGLAPMASLAAEAALLDALASELVSRLGGAPRDFARNHPGGSLGRRARSLAR